MRDEYIAADDMSVRELAQRHGVPTTRISSIQRMARIQGWDELRRKRVATADDKTVAVMADRQAVRRGRVMEVQDHGLELIDEAIQKLRDDLKATKKVQDPETKRWTLEPAVRYRPSEVVQLMDRLKELFGEAPTAEPSVTEGRFFGLTANLDGADPAQRALIAGLAGLASSQPRAADPRRVGDSPLPSSPGPRTDQ